MSSKKNQTRKKILQATWKMLEESNGQNTKMADIAKTAGISRQAMYLHFDSRIELMIATVKYVDEIKELNKRLELFNAAKTGVEMLNSLVEVWGNYIPEIYSIAKAMLLTKENDEATATAWMGCMSGLRSYCQQTIETIYKEKQLNHNWKIQEAVEILWTYISIHNWEQLTLECNWSNQKFIKNTQTLLHSILLT